MNKAHQRCSISLALSSSTNWHFLTIIIWADCYAIKIDKTRFVSNDMMMMITTMIMLVVDSNYHYRKWQHWTHVLRYIFIFSNLHNFFLLLLFLKCLMWRENTIIRMQLQEIKHTFKVALNRARLCLHVFMIYMYIRKK